MLMKMRAPSEAVGLGGASNLIPMKIAGVDCLKIFKIKLSFKVVETFWVMSKLLANWNCGMIRRPVVVYF